MTWKSPIGLWPFSGAPIPFLMHPNMIPSDFGLEAIPLPIGIVDDRHSGGKNCIAVKYCGVVSVSPPVVYFSIDNLHLQKLLLNEASLRFYLPSVAFFELLFGENRRPSGSEIAEFFRSTKLGIDTSRVDQYCHIQLDCTAIDTIPILNHIVFLCEVKHSFITRRCLSEGDRNPHLDDISPVVQSSNHTLWRIGKPVSDAFSIGNLYGGSISGIAKHKLKSLAKTLILSGYSNLLKLKQHFEQEHKDSIVKVEIPTRALIYPLPAILVGSYLDNQPNFSVVANCGIISEDPPIIYVSSHRSHYTNKGIIQNRSFSVSVPNVGAVVKTDYCGIYSGNRVDKSSVFRLFTKHSGNAPLINECPATIECQLIHQYPLKRMDIFVGEVRSAYISKSCIRNDHVDISNINPLLYALNRKYWSIGSRF